MRRDKRSRPDLGRARSTATRQTTGTPGWRKTTGVCLGTAEHSLLERVSAIDRPVFVANGDSDPMILPRYSYLLAASSPRRVSRSTGRRARLPLQHHTEFAADVGAFLASA